MATEVVKKFCLCDFPTVCCLLHVVEFCLKCSLGDFLICLFCGGLTFDTFVPPVGHFVFLLCFLDFFMQFCYFFIDLEDVFILLNEISDSLILFKFYNISCYLLCSFSERSI